MGTSDDGGWAGTAGRPIMRTAEAPAGYRPDPRQRPTGASGARDYVAISRRAVVSRREVYPPDERF